MNREGVFKILAVVAGVCLIIFLIFYRSTKTIIIQYRYWIYEVDVGHNETTTSVTTDTDGNVHVSTSTEWESTCKQSRRGETLPPIRPEILCQDEKQKEVIGYYVTYRIEEGDKVGQAEFKRNMWDNLSPGSIVTVKVTILGSITRIEKKLR